jgi:hypothetical protein
LGPILHWARGARNIVATAVVIFFCAFFLSAYIRPAPATPNLVAVPVAMIVGTPSGVPGNIAGVVAIMEVINRGTGASVARNWSLKAKIDDATYEGKQIRIPPNFSLSTINHAKIVFHDEDALYLKTSKPIEPGGAVTGIAAYNFEHISMDTFLNRKTTFIISFVDAFDREYSIEAPLKPVNDTVISYFPGLRMEVLPQ